MGAGLEALDGVIARLVSAGWKERDAIKAELAQLTEAYPDRKAALDHLENAKRGIAELEVRWEVDEVIEKLTPAAAPPPPPKPDDKNRPLSAADLTLVYDDPRGLLLHKTKVGERWFATQRDPRTGQPQTFELRAEEVQQLKTQLAGSPYWLIGGGA